MSGLNWRFWGHFSGHCTSFVFNIVCYGVSCTVFVVASYKTILYEIVFVVSCYSIRCTAICYSDILISWAFDGTVFCTRVFMACPGVCAFATVMYF